MFFDAIIDSYEEPSPLEYPRPGIFQRFALWSPEAGPTTERYFAPTERVHRYGKTGKLLKTPRIETFPGARPGTLAWLDWHQLAPGDLYIDFMTVRSDWRSHGLGRQLVEQFYQQVVIPRGYAYVDWGQILSDYAERLFHHMRRQHPQIQHKARL